MAIVPFRAPNGECGVGHGDVQDSEEPIAVGHREVVGAGGLVGGLVPMDAGVALPEGRELGLRVGARRSGSATERLDNIQVSPVRRACESTRGPGRNCVLLSTTNGAVNVTVAR